MKVWTAMTAALLLCGVLHADRTVWYVHPDSALNTIQSALDTCADNDIVLVAPGTYYENIVWPSKQGIHLISELGAEATIIDGSDTGTVVRLEGNIIDNSTIIRGFKIQHGHGHGYPGYDWWGGGIYCNDLASPVIVDNIITNNVADSMGGGILSANGASPVIRDNIITENSAVWGGGVAQWFPVSRPKIIKNEIYNNTAINYGGGIYTNYYSRPLIDSCTVFDNYATYGGSGVFAYYECSLKIANTTVINNSQPTAIQLWQNCFADLFNCTVSNPTISQGINCRNNSEVNIWQCSITDHLIGLNLMIPSNAIINYSNLENNSLYGVLNQNANIIINAEDNWWGDATGPYHPDSNPGGLGSPVSNYVDFTPWMLHWGVEETPIVKTVKNHDFIHPTIFRGPLVLPKGRKCRVFDITGRKVEPASISPGIYFVEIDGKIENKVIKVR